MLDLPITARRYQYEVESLVVAHRAGIPILEAPVSVVYQETRISHFRPWVDFFRNSNTFSRLLLLRLFGR